MEDVLGVYCLPYDPAIPQVCMDETSKQLISETRVPIPMAPGRPVRYDDEYVRHGVAAVFLFVEPLTGQCHATATAQRTAADRAQQIKELLEVHYPTAAKIRLVMDNLNTHTTASLYATFPAPEARRLAERLEIHPTPKHGSWLNMAEIALSALSRQCLDRRLPDMATLQHEIVAWNLAHNARPAPINWRFTTADARIKLRRLYPTF